MIVEGRFEEAFYELLNMNGALWVLLEQEIYFCHRIADTAIYHSEVNQQSLAAKNF